MLLAAAVVGQAPRLGRWAPLLVGGAIVAGTVALLAWRRHTSGGGAPSLARWVGPLAACWLVVAILPVHKFDHGGDAAGSPTLSKEILIHIVAFATVAVVAHLVVQEAEPTPLRQRPPMVLLLLPFWTALSCLWSGTSAYALVRGWQLLVVGYLAWATVALGRGDPARLDALVEAFLRWFVRVTVALIGLGVALGPVYVSASEANLDRFTWMGAHPLGSGAILSIAVVIVATTSARALRLPPFARLAMAGLFVGFLVPNHSRQSWLFLAAALLVGLVLGGRISPLVAGIGAPLVGAAAVATVLYGGSEVWGYLLRNEDTSTLSTGNGRIELWGIGLRALDTAFEWAFGLGFGVTRTLFVEEAPWAHSAHSSFLAALVSLGVIGLVLLVVLLGTTLRDLIVSRVWADSSAGLTLTLLFGVVLLNGVVSDNLVIPNVGMGVLYLVAAVGIVHRERTRQASAVPVEVATGSLR